MIKVTCTRPLCAHDFFFQCTYSLTVQLSDLLLTEPIVQSFSVSAQPCLSPMAVDIIDDSFGLASLGESCTACWSKLHSLLVFKLLKGVNKRSVTTEFQSVYNFSVSETGLVLLTLWKAVLSHMCTAPDICCSQYRSYYRFHGEYVPGNLVPVRHPGQDVRHANGLCDPENISRQRDKKHDYTQHALLVLSCPSQCSSMHGRHRPKFLG